MDIIHSGKDKETSFEVYKKKSRLYERERKDNGDLEPMGEPNLVPMADSNPKPMADDVPAGPPDGYTEPPPDGGPGGGPVSGQSVVPWVMTSSRITTTIRTRRTRTTPFRLSFTEECDYLAYYCMRAYDTGKLCARTLYHVYHDFVNYCMLDYVNCMERYEVWQVVHMGACFTLEPLREFKHYPYENDYFLDDYYLVEDNI